MNLVNKIGTNVEREFEYYLLQSSNEKDLQLNHFHISK